HAIDFFLKKFNIKKEEVESIDYRGDGWPGYMKIFRKNGQVMKYSFPSYWTIAGSNFFYPKRCLACSDCSSEFADISFGDAWLPEFKKDTIGRSLIISRTEKGDAILKQAQEQGVIELEQIPLKKALFPLMGALYLKKKGLKFFFPLSSEEIQKPNLLDGIICFPLFLNSALGRNWFFRNTLRFVPLRFTALYARLLNMIYRRKAKGDFKKHIG
ncbi:Coenzyme F420 hydrogenase/dehydrogenase, beta subunit C-terminal domain, partial [Patescibacteria group bacterium]